MATSSEGTRPLLSKAHRRKKRKSKLKQEMKTDEKGDMELKGKWKVADVDYSALKLDELREFMGIEELSLGDHEVIIANPRSKRSKNRNRRNRKQLALDKEQTAAKRKTPPSQDQKSSPTKKQKTEKQAGQTSNPSAVSDAKLTEDDSQADSAPSDQIMLGTEGPSPPPKPAKKKTKSQKQKTVASTGQGNADENADEAVVKVPKKDSTGKEVDGAQKSKKIASSFTKGIPAPKKEHSINMSAWKKLHVPAPVLQAIQDLGFTEPTPIQKASIPSAIKDGKDIVGAAETGSGKTLAFGIPVIHNILQHQAALQREARSEAFKQANTDRSAAAAKPVSSGKERSHTVGDTSPQKKTNIPSSSKTERSGTESRDSVSEGMRGKLGKGKRKDELMVFEAKGSDEDDDDYDEDDAEAMEGIDEEDIDEEDIDEEDIDEEDIDEEDIDEVNEEDIDEEDDDEDIEYDFDDDSDEDEEGEDEDIDFDEDDDQDDDDFGEDQEEEDSDVDEEDAEESIEDTDPTKKQKPKTGVDEPADKPASKRPRGKKGPKKRRFRIPERKMLELDGTNFEGVELINKMEKRGFGCVRAIDDISNEEMMAQIGLRQTGGEVEATREGSHSHRPLYAMILMPTRELAVQVKNHLVEVTKYTDIKIAVIVGGMSAQKQERVLKKQPEIVVGTPGRIWELFKEGEPHLSTMAGIRCLVLDEADRMVERGHYEQLTEILQQMNRSPASLQRQTFVFSATLTLVHLGPDRKTAKNRNPKQEKKSRKGKLHALMTKVGIRDEPAVVDLTQKQGTVATLMEAKIICDISDKDIYLYYFLLQFPGRTLVFCNSIDCIRRLCSILTLLACSPLPLHSSMHQKQRLKNLDRFASNPKALLLATDVAARGLDIPDVQHVIHYQVPRTSEIYIHRSGRTARQAKEGISIMFVSPTEANSYRRLCKTLNRDDITSFPVDHLFYNAVKARVDMARMIDQATHRVAKKKHSNDWFIKAAKELDVDLDEDLVPHSLHDLGDSREQMEHERKIQQMKVELKKLLQKTVFPRGSSWLYPTAEGKLISPLTLASSSAYTVVQKKISNKMKDGAQQGETLPKKVKKSKNKFKRIEEEKAT